MTEPLSELLKRVAEGNAVAASQVVYELDRLRTQLANWSACADTYQADILRLTASLSQATTQLTAAEAVCEALCASHKATWEEAFSAEAGTSRKLDTIKTKQAVTGALAQWHALRGGDDDGET